MSRDSFDGQIKMVDNVANIYRGYTVSSMFELCLAYINDSGVGTQLRPGSLVAGADELWRELLVRLLGRNGANAGCESCTASEALANCHPQRHGELVDGAACGVKAVGALGRGKNSGAEGGIRTRTSRSSQPPEDCVSTNFTTSARSVAEAGFEPAAKGL